VQSYNPRHATHLKRRIESSVRAVVNDCARELEINAGAVSKR